MYSIAELCGEKLRALAERCRPRDLYDVVHMHRHPDLIGLARGVRSALERKCAHSGIDVPTVEIIRRSVANPFHFRFPCQDHWSLGSDQPVSRWA